MLTRRISAIFTLLICLALLSTACGDDDTEPARTGVEPSTTVADGSPTEAGESTTSAQANATTTAAPASTTTVEQPAAAAPSIDSLLGPETPLNIAHAGGDQAYPHSTMFAFSEAVADGADVLELDVQLSGDGVLIVQHDDTVDKTTNETGPVADRTLEELKALDNAYWFSPECWPCQDRPVEEYIHRGVRTGDVSPPEGYSPEDFTILTFRELAEAFPQMPLDIEIKGDYPDTIEVAEMLAEEIDELERTESVVVVSFSADTVTAFKEIAPDVATSPGVDEMVAWYLQGEELGDHPVIQVPPFFEGVEVINAEFMAAASEAGVDVWVWPNDASAQENEAFYREMIAEGADGIIAGRPAEMTAAVS